MNSPEILITFVAIDILNGKNVVDGCVNLKLKNFVRAIANYWKCKMKNNNEIIT